MLLYDHITRYRYPVIISSTRAKSVLRGVIVCDNPRGLCISTFTTVRGINKKQSKEKQNLLPKQHIHSNPTALTTMTGLESINGGKKWYTCRGPMVLGEAPIYRANDSTLHWVDCLSEPARLYILKLDKHGNAVGEARILELADSVTVAFFRKNRPGSYIGAYSQGVCVIDEATGKLDVVKEIIPTSQRDELRFNDGGIDAKGRFWLAEIDKKAMAFGPNRLPASYGIPRGRLWRYDPDGSLHLMVSEGVICGNGLGWSPDNKTSEFFSFFLLSVSVWC